MYTPYVFRSRTYDFVIDGDMYATATDDSLLHLGYEALTALELDLPFAVKVLTLIQTNEFLALLNLANTPATLARVVGTAIVVSDFLVRNPHIPYHDLAALQRPHRRRPRGARSSLQTRTETRSPERHRAQRIPGTPPVPACDPDATVAVTAHVLNDEFAVVSVCDLPLTFGWKPKRPPTMQGAGTIGSALPSRCRCSSTS